MPTEKRQRQREGRQYRQQEMQRAQRRRHNQRRFIVGGVIAAVVIVVLFLANRGGDDNTSVSSATSTTAGSDTTTTAGAGEKITGDTPCPKADGSSLRTTSFEKAPPTCIDPAKTYTATMETDVGTMKILLDAKKAPKTVNNFVVLARYHYYDGVVFHRVIPGFVVQGGDPQGTGSSGPGYEFADELPKAGEYKVGSLAMANSGPNTNGSQFFVITGNQGVQLPPSYSLFGAVSEGIDVAKKIEADGDPGGTPKVVHKMTKVTIQES